jgi:hypothetical protein
MFGLIKSQVDRGIVISHHLGSGLTGLITFGFVVYLLDIGGFRTQALSSGSVHGAALHAIGGVLVAFTSINVLMRRLMGKHGVF